jgi:hypothetical protein
MVMKTHKEHLSPFLGADLAFWRRVLAVLASSSHPLCLRPRLWVPPSTPPLGPLRFHSRACRMQLDKISFSSHRHFIGLGPAHRVRGNRSRQTAASAASTAQHACGRWGLLPLGPSHSPYPANPLCARVCVRLEQPHCVACTLAPAAHSFGALNHQAILMALLGTL